MKYFKELLTAQNSGINQGVCSICTSNKYVIQAALEFGKKHDTYILIESTSNQVNQFGGYTGMKPSDFVEYVYSIANSINFDISKLILGGDHLGPNPFQSDDSETAMIKAEEMIKQYVLAGYMKIHIDCSMRLGGDSTTEKLSDDVIATRTVRLAKVAEDAFSTLKNANQDLEHPVYVIGSEVPIPGGAQLDHTEIQITSINDFKTTVEVTKNKFLSNNLQEAWENVVGVVVQPGVEFGDEHIDFYDRSKAKSLMNEIREYDNLTFEGHSTDYQHTDGLCEMVEDGVGILKVGPELTYALREGLFNLEMIEKELVNEDKVSNFSQILINEMKANPSNWQKHYKDDIDYKLKYSLLDRSRYYYDQKVVKDALQKLINNLSSINIPNTILSQFMPKEYQAVRSGDINNDPESLIKYHISEVFKSYQKATNQK